MGRYFSHPLYTFFFKNDIYKYYSRLLLFVEWCIFTSRGIVNLHSLVMILQPLFIFHLFFTTNAFLLSNFRLLINHLEKMHQTQKIVCFDNFEIHQFLARISYFIIHTLRNFFAHSMGSFSDFLLLIPHNRKLGS
jgi:hypothetical protein